MAPDHHALFYLNDYLVHDAWWGGMTPYQFEADFPGSVLQKGENALRVVAQPVPGTSFQTIVTDWFEITYRDTDVAEDDSLAFSQDDAGTWQYRVGNFSQPSVEAFDITDPTNVSRIISTSIAQMAST